MYIWALRASRYEPLRVLSACSKELRDRDRAKKKFIGGAGKKKIGSLEFFIKKIVFVVFLN